MLKSAIRFGLVGAANTLVGLAIIAAMLHVGAGDYLANAISYAAGLCLSFTLNRSFTFGMRGAISASEIQRFLAVFAASYAANVGMLTLMRLAGFAQTMTAQMTAMIAYSACFFLLSRRYVFSAGEHPA